MPFIPVIPEHRGPGLIGRRLFQMLRQPGPVENVVPQNHGTPVPVDELLTQNKRLGQAIRRRLHLVAQMDPIPAPIPQQPLKIRQILGGGNDQDIPDPGQHQRGQGIENHGFIINGKQLLRRNHSQRIQTGAGAPG